MDLPDLHRPQGARPVSMLLLDDSALDRETLQRFLRSDLRREYCFRECSDIDDALAQCLQSPPDCILLDYSLESGTGLDFLEALAGEFGSGQRIPVVMLTGSGNEQLVANAFKAGAFDYLPKHSVTADMLQRAVAGAIYKAETERVLAEQRRELERLFHEAQEANARKDRFLANLSHELRTPLTPVLAAVTSAQPAQLSTAELEEIFATIRRNVELEARLIDDLLDLTRIAKGKLRLELRPTNARQVLEHALSTCVEEASAKRLQWQLRLEAENPLVLADAARLQQVFWNLLKNAVKFSPAGARIEVRTFHPTPEQLAVTVHDGGIGIAAEVLPRIFDAFEQGTTEINHRYGGLGLGLAISRALTDAHGGQIRAESAGPGTGATFTVTFPLTREVLPAASAPLPLVPEPTAEPRQKPWRVLLVEDHADSARLLIRSLRRRGYEVLSAASVEEALALYRLEPVDVVVSDIGLPDGSGFELMQQLHAIRPVLSIALSGFGMEQDVAQARAAGFVEHLTKPVDWSQLDAALTRVLARSEDERAD